MDDIPALGSELVQAITRARSEVVFVAPFIKADALRRLLDAVPAGVPVTCYTRWRPEEVVANVSDLEVWPLLRGQGGSLRLRYDLHAKAFRVDEACFVGSANVTGSALGWAPRANLELLIAVSVDDERLSTFFQRLESNAVEVTEEIYLEMRRVVADRQGLLIPPQRPPAEGEVPIVDEGTRNSLAGWLPRCRVPGNHNLYRTYLRQWNMVNRTTYEDASHDLRVLGIPDGLPSETVFLRYVSAVFRQSPIVGLVLGQTQDCIRPEEGQNLLRREFGNSAGGDDGMTGSEWATLRTWLATFLSGEFRQRYGEGGPELVRGVRIA
ncbi:phospholipase D family protein [Micromonospora sp. MP36]|uniref:phospholipase D family protein n=1 Tax=unclassified Micromonospora TaxID=2617518 RepID=UPI00351B4C8B